MLRIRGRDQRLDILALCCPQEALSPVADAGVNIHVQQFIEEIFQVYCIEGNLSRGMRCRRRCCVTVGVVVCK